MDKNCEKVCAWLSEVEDDYTLIDSDDDSDFCMKMWKVIVMKAPIKLSTSNVHRLSLSLSGKNITIISKGFF